jgi:hypothetical protein
MSNSQEPNLPSKGQFLVYRAEDGRVQIEVRLENETVWLTQQHMADLFQSSKQNVGQHLKRIFEEGELTESSVVKNFFTTAADGKEYRTNYYNLDAIISVGYRITSAVATRFRIWATQKLREFIVKGFVLDDERLKNPDQPFDYFEEIAAATQAEEERQEVRRGGDRGGVGVDDMQTIELICPLLPPVVAATKRFDPIHAEIGALIEQIQNLRRTRDLLLPRRLSGQVALESVSANGASSNQPGATPQASTRKSPKG